ncbi:MAG TPA: DUF3667 domain-containing protein [Rubricoccaceae bacterium]|jgi:hypothetical protein
MTPDADRLASSAAARRALPTASIAAVAALPPADPALPAEAGACASCREPLVGAYCHACGERRLGPHDYRLSHFFEYALHTFTHFDFKVPRSVWSLVRRPGVMTADVLAGRRVGWASPLQVFVLVNLAFYLLASASNAHFLDAPLENHLSNGVYGTLAQRIVAGHLAGPGAVAYREHFDAVGHTLSKTVPVLLVPLFAMTLAVLFWRRRRYALEHLTAAVHLVSLLLVVGMAVLVGFIALVYGLRLHLSGDTPLVAFYFTSLAASFAVFFRRVYGEAWAVSAAKGIAFVTVFAVVLHPLYRFLLFLATVALA